MTRESIFKDEGLQKDFDKNGFVKIPLLNEKSIDSLKALQKMYFPNDSNRFFSSSYLDDFDLKTSISDKIVNILNPELHQFFNNYRNIGAAFLIKGTGENSEMPMHQDWTIVDETRYYAVNVWIPLVSTNEENGTLELMKGSHNWNNALRAPSLPMSFTGHEEKIKNHLTKIDTELGEAIVLNQATIHYSKPNYSTHLRPAITMGLVNKNATLKFHYWDPDRKKIEVFEQEDDFLLRFENFHQSIYERPMMGKSTGFVDYSIPKISKHEISHLLNEPKPANGIKRFFKKLFRNEETRISG